MKKFQNIIFPVIAAVSLTAAAAALTDALMTICYINAQVNPLTYKVVRFNPVAFRWGIAAAGGIIALIAAIFSANERIEQLRQWEKILRPAWLLWFIPCGTFPGVLAAVAVIALTVFNAAGVWRKALPELPQKYGTAIALAGGFAVAVWGYYLQIRAYDSLHFIWGDWNQYVEHYFHLLSGKANFAQWCAGAGHWNFGVNLFMIAALKVWYAPDAVFIVNALCIASVIPLGYWLCRKCNLSTWTSPVLLILAVFNPVLSNQYLSLFYGFHPIVFFVPLLLGFFIAREYKNRYFMATCFVLSLLVQETVCVFWAGYAVYLLCCKRWKSGIALFGAMVGLFFFFSNVVIPAAHEAENYSQMFHYAHLGNNMGEVLLSPVTRPGVFWKTVFDRSTLCFGLAVFIPFLYGVIFKPLMLIALLPIFAGVILQGSPDVKTVMLQYGLECTVFSLIVMILNLKRIYPELRRPALCAVLVSTLLCGWMLGMVPGSPGPLKRMLNRPSGVELMNFFDQAAGNAERIAATGRIRGQFQFQRPTVPLKDIRPGDAVIIDLHDHGIEDGRAISAVRRKLAADMRVVPVTYVIWENHTIVMFKVLGQPHPRPTVPWLRPVPEELFTKGGGLLIHREEGVWELRYARINNKNTYRLRLEKAQTDDIELSIKQYENGIATEAVIAFGNGLFPAYSVPPGTMFEFVLPGGVLNKVEVNVYNIK